MYVPVKVKFSISFAIAAVWVLLSFYLAVPWIIELANVVGIVWSWIIIFGIAIVPGFMNAFLVSSLLLDRRPARRTDITDYPDIAIIIAAYNEEGSILSTLESINRQSYPGNVMVFAVNDGSTDKTLTLLQAAKGSYSSWLEVIDVGRNVGKAAALNCALPHVTATYTITLDADSYLHKDALKNIVERMLSDPADTAAVAGAVLIRNSRRTLVTKMQEWDYFHGIAAVKRLQSLYQGTLVAQGAFSIYKTDVLREIKGWPLCVGEDIVLTWAILNKGHRVGYAEDACVFTNAPETWSQFIRQRQRWSRGLIEAFKDHYSTLSHPRMTSFFVWWNLTFPYLDLVYTFAFIPGVILAFLGYYYIAGPMTLFVIPLAMLVQYIMFRAQSRMFAGQKLKVRKNFFGFLCYSLFYSLILQPACVVGYTKELFRGSIKNWGTK